MLNKNPILNRNLNLTSKNAYKSPLDIAIGVNNSLLIDFLLEKGASPGKGLAAAASVGDTTMIDMLLSKGAEIDACSGFGYGGGNCYTALSSAAKLGLLDMVRYLLAKGAKPYNGIIQAVENKHYGIARILLEAGAPSNISRDEQVSLFSRMIMKNDVQAVKLLLEYGADPNPSNISKFDNFPLRVAEEAANPEMLHLLKSMIKERTTQSQNPDQSILDAIETRNYTVLTRLAPAFDYSGHRARNTNPALRAIANEDTTAMRILVKAGVLKYPDSQFGQDVLRALLVKRNPDLIRCIYENTGNMTSNDNATLSQSLELTYQTLLGNADEVASLLEDGANPFVNGKNRESPLLFAVEQNQIVISYLLLQKGALKKSWENGSYCLAVAATKNLTTQFDLLIDAGAGVRHGSSVTYYFSRHIEEERFHIARTMLAAGYPLEAGVQGSPLIAAIKAKNPGLVGLMLYAGADPNEKPDRTETPLIEAVYAGDLTVIRLLLMFGADNTLTNKMEYKSSYLSQKMRKDGIMAVLNDENIHRW